MQFPESWLRAYCNPPIDSAALAEVLTMAGLEVEERRPVAPPFSCVVVGHIVAAEQHPNADRLRVCRVDAGVHSPDGPLQIVCGAPNARVGIKVPLALVGAELPPGEDGKPFSIRMGKLRGVESFGMLCSGRELGLSQDHGGLLELEAAAPIGADLRETLALDDFLLTLKLTPNLAHHLSVRGIARELSALTGAPFHDIAIPKHSASIDDRLPVQVSAPDLCGRFSGRVVRGLRPGVSTPAWMLERLARCGQRGVHPLVDISNYVMFELGQPTHIFDLAKVSGGLEVRWARTGESLALLNGQTVTVDPQVGVIADASGLESLAGIMGGEATAVGDATTDVYIEAAHWWPKAVAGRARRFHFSTDAAHRFERGVDPELTLMAIDRITELVLAICGGEATHCGPVDDQRLASTVRPSVAVRVSRVAKVLGMAVPGEECVALFQRLGFECTVDGGTITVVPPSWRFDIQIEEDLIEEVARLVGFDRLPLSPPIAPVQARVRPEARKGVHAIRHRLANLDYQEGIHFSFVEEKWERELAGNTAPIRVLNPIASQLSVMRSSLLGGLVAAAKSNLARRHGRVRLFEVGRVFARDASVTDSDTTVAGIHQPMRVAGIALGSADPLQWGSATRPVDFFDVKGDIELLLAPVAVRFQATTHPALHPGRCASVELGGRSIGIIGELHPRWRQSYELPSAPVLFELELDPVLTRIVPQYQPVSKLQASSRDLALWVGDGVSHDALIAALSADPTGLVRSVRLFDVYRPKPGAEPVESVGRSMAVRLELLDDEVALTEERIEQAVAAALQRAERLGVHLRG